MKSKKLYTKVLGLALAALTLTACSDTWDEHYGGTAEGVMEGSLWQAIKNDPNLSNFASVMEACGFNKSLASSQVFTVFAPTNANFSAEEAAALIAAYNAEKGKVSEEDNTVIKEFVKNHVAMYSYSVAPGVKDSLMLMNGKHVVLSKEKIANATIQEGKDNLHYQNGVLYVIDEQIDYKPNVFEALRKDADLDSLRSFMYSNYFYRKEFEANLSVAGSIVDGKTVYLDSVFSQVNDLFDKEFLSARLTEEDSVYTMVAPTNEVWRNLLETYEPYFNYAPKTADRDSMVYTFPRLAIVKGTIFSETFNSTKALQDSAFSTSAVKGENREKSWHIPFLHYYQFGDGQNSQHKPLQSNGVLNASAESIECSNGKVLKANTWNINPLNTFNQVIFVSAAERSNIQDMSKEKSKTTQELEEIVDMSTLTIAPTSPYYNKVWGNTFVQFKPMVSKDVFYTFNITNVLSNMKYDIYLVSVPALANDSNATNVQRLPTRFDAMLYYTNANGKKDSTDLVKEQPTQKDIIDYVRLSPEEGFAFPCCTYGLNESTPQITLKITTNVTALQIRRGTYNRNLGIAYLLLVPHGASWTDDQNFYLAPHGDGEEFIMSKCKDINLEQ